MKIINQKSLLLCITVLLHATLAADELSPKGFIGTPAPAQYDGPIVYEDVLNNTPMSVSDKLTVRGTSCCLADILNDILDILEQPAPSSTCCKKITCITNADIDPDLGYTITAAGFYCLAEDVLWTNSSVTCIKIDANYVDLDLSGHTIDLGGSGSRGVRSFNVHDVTVHNGFVVNNPNGQGVAILNTAHAVVQDIVCNDFNAGTGIFVQGSRDITLQSCRSTNGLITGSANLHIADCFFTTNNVVTNFKNLDIQTSRSILLENVIATNFGCNPDANTFFSANFVFTTCSNCILNNCIAENAIEGFLFQTQCAEFQVNNCLANRHNAGFDVFSSSRSVAFNNCLATAPAGSAVGTIGFYIEAGSNDVSLFQCEAYNAAAGTLFGDPAANFLVTGCSNVSLQQCIGSNGRAGFIVNGSNNIYLYNNLAAQNSTNGFSFDSATNRCDVRQNTAITNTTNGFIDSHVAVSTNRFYQNVAHANGTQFSGVSIPVTVGFAAATAWTNVSS